MPFPQWAVPNVTYSWSGPVAFSSTQQSPTIANATSANSGFYTLTETSTITGCHSAGVATNVIVTTHPDSPRISSNSPVCYGSPLTLQATSTPGSSFTWSGPNGYSSQSSFVSISNATTANAGTYTVTANINGCYSPASSVTVVVNPLPPSPAVQNDTFCQGSTPPALTASAPNLLWYTSQTGGTGSSVAPVPATSVAGMFYYYVSQLQNGCESNRSQIIVTVLPKPAVPIVSSPIAYCQGAAAVALTASGQNLLWYATASSNSGSSTAIIPTTTNSGNTDYYVTQTVNGCESNKEGISVVVHPLPAAPGVHDTSYCVGDQTVQLTASGQYIVWYTSPVSSPSSIAPTPQSNIADTTDWYATQTVNGCESPKARIQVIVYSIPQAVISTSKNSFLCKHDTMTFYYGDILEPGYTFNWQFPAGAQVVMGNPQGAGPLTVEFDSTGSSFVTMTVNNNHCSAFANYQVFVIPAPDANVLLPKQACLTNPVTLSVQSQVDVSSYNLSLDGAKVLKADTVVGNYSLNWEDTGLHYVTVTLHSSNQCPTNTIHDTITVYPAPDATFTTAITQGICTGDTVLFSVAHVSDGYIYQWSPAQSFRNDTATPVYGRIDVSGFVYLNVKSNFGCHAADSVLLQTQPCCQVYFPNAFTPNGDGKNDVFRTITPGHHDLKELRVINRWGQTVFQTNQESYGWDGNFNGEPQPMGTYYYYIKYTCSSGQVFEQKGDLILVR